METWGKLCERLSALAVERGGTADVTDDKVTLRHPRSEAVSVYRHRDVEQAELGVRRVSVPRMPYDKALSAVIGITDGGFWETDLVDRESGRVVATLWELHSDDGSEWTGASHSTRIRLVESWALRARA